MINLFKSGRAPLALPLSCSSEKHNIDQLPDSLHDAEERYKNVPTNRLRKRC
jgi:hypothetical protein